MPRSSSPASPNVYHLWDLYRSDLIALSVWAAAGIWQSLLSLSNTSTQRDAVRTGNVALNTVLAQECAAYANAVFNYSFTKSQVSKLDYFHPGPSGQAALASITWDTSWWA